MDKLNDKEKLHEIESILGELTYLGEDAQSARREVDASKVLSLVYKAWDILYPDCNKDKAYKIF